MPRSVSILITDLDNTLFDWLAMWHAAFSALLDELVRISGVPEDELLDEIRSVHQRYGTSEYAFLIEELTCVRRPQESREEVLQRFEPAIRAYGAARKETLRLYPGVLETLKRLRKQGVVVAGYTESFAYYSNYRVRKLGLDGLLQVLYSPPDHDLPPGISRQSVRSYPPDHYRFQETEHRHTPAGEHKPQPDLLAHIVRSLGGDLEDAVYVGDSLLKDVAMAQDAGVRDVLAEYGRTQDRQAYELLKRVTHWTDEDVAREKRLLERPPVQPAYVLVDSFAELLDLFDFSAFPAATR